MGKIFISKNKKRYADIVKILLRYELDVNKTDVYGQCALMYACKADSVLCVQLLLQVPGIDVYWKDSINRCSRDYANSRLIQEVLDQFIQKQLDILMADELVIKDSYSKNMNFSRTGSVVDPNDNKEIGESLYDKNPNPSCRSLKVWKSQRSKPKLEDISENLTKCVEYWMNDYKKPIWAFEDPEMDKELSPEKKKKKKFRIGAKSGFVHNRHKTKNKQSSRSSSSSFDDN